jgi:hypothetical protein
MSSGRRSRPSIHGGTPVRVSPSDRIGQGSTTSGLSQRQILKVDTPVRGDSPNRNPVQATWNSAPSTRQVIHGDTPVQIPLAQMAHANTFAQRTTFVVNAGEPTRVNEPTSKKG